MAAVRERLHRLERLRGLLAAGDPVRVKDLAAELQVSARTILRDLELLRDEGFLIEADRGRGGGVRLSRGHSAGDIRLTTAEAMDILLSLALAEEARSPMLITVRTIRQKIAAVFVRAEREKIRSLRKRILIGRPASTNVVAAYEPGRLTDAHEIRRAFLELKVLDLIYRDERGCRSRRAVEPHYFYLNPPVWYVLAWDHLRNDVRTFRVDRILQASASDRSFRLREATPFLLTAESGAAPL